MYELTFPYRQADKGEITRCTINLMIMIQQLKKRKVKIYGFYDRLLVHRADFLLGRLLSRVRGR